ncbi:MAG: hypothetical protein ACM3P0_09630 [Acidobacteriota bacterium]
MLNRDFSVIISINEAIASIKEPYRLFEKIFDQLAGFAPVPDCRHGPDR